MTELFIIDADTLIRAKNTYYQFERVPPFWKWLAHHVRRGVVKMNHETWVKIAGMPKDKRDDLADWAFDLKDDLVVSDRSYDQWFPTVLEQYAHPDKSPFTDANVTKIGDDYQLIACAYANNATVVTREVSAPNKVGPNRKVPDVCTSLGLECIDLDGLNGSPGLLVRLDFRTDWDS